MFFDGYQDARDARDFSIGENTRNLSFVPDLRVWISLKNELAFF